MSANIYWIQVSILKQNVSILHKQNHLSWLGGD